MWGYFLGGAGFAGLLFALRARRYRRWTHGYGHHGPRGRLRWLFRRLDTSPAQEKVILEVFDSLKEEAQKLRDEWRPLRSTFAQAVGGEHFDSAVLQEMFTRHDGRMQELRTALTAGLSRIHEALDEKQRRALAELLQSGPGYGHHGGHRHGCYKARYA